MSVLNLVRENIKNMKPYSSARDEFKESSNNVIFLDANENPFENGVNRYPDPQQLKVKQSIATIKNITVEHILLGNGSDEVLDLIFRAFCEPKEDSVITLPPTYGMYDVLASLNDIKVNKVELDVNFQPKVDAILSVNNAKILFLCSPNNPTGNSFDTDKIEQLIKQFKGIVVIDEAYIDFSEEEGWLYKLAEFPNLIITQTLSKAFGMAGARLGICYASKEVIAVLNKIKPPYNINELSQQSVLRQFQNLSKIDTEVSAIVAEREKLKNALNSIEWVEKVYPSEANFLLVKVDNANKRYKQLMQQGIVVRNRTNQPLCKNCLRLTIGTASENQKLITALKNS